MIHAGHDSRRPCFAGRVSPVGQAHADHDGRPPHVCGQPGGHRTGGEEQLSHACDFRYSCRMGCTPHCAPCPVLPCPAFLCARTCALARASPSLLHPSGRGCAGAPLARERTILYGWKAVSSLALLCTTMHAYVDDMCLHAHAHTYIMLCPCLCTRTQTSTHMHARPHAPIHTHTHIHTNVHARRVGQDHARPGHHRGLRAGERQAARG